jgi:hypothetical protein
VGLRGPLYTEGLALLPINAYILSPPPTIPLPSSCTTIVRLNSFKELKGISWKYKKQISTFHSNGNAIEIQKGNAIMGSGYSWKVF